MLEGRRRSDQGLGYGRSLCGAARIRQHAIRSVGQGCGGCQRCSAKAVADVNDVKTSLIRTRRIIFTPTVALKDELANTAIQITCYDRNGNIVKRVTSADPGTVEEPEGDENGTNGATEQGGSGTEGGGNGGSSTSSETATTFALTISKTGTGSASVTKDGNAVASGSNLSEDDEVEISITPAEGQVPTATVNGSSIELTEDNGVYTGSFAMPGQASTLVINTGEEDDYNPIDTGN